MFEGELQLLEQTIAKKQKEEAAKREDLTKKEKTLTQLEEEVRKKLEIQGGNLLYFIQSWNRKGAWRTNIYR